MERMRNMKSALSKRVAIAASLAALVCATFGPVAARPERALALDNDLSIAKTDNVTSVERGTPTTYSITVVNNDTTSRVADVLVNDTMPAGLTVVSWTCSTIAPSICATPDGTGDINATVTLEPSAAATFTVTGTVSETSNTLANTATVTGPVGFVDADPANDTATDTDAVYDSVDLSITKTDGLTSLPRGGSMQYSIVATNNGAVTVPAAHITDPMPAQLATATWTCAAVAPSTCSTSSGSGSIDTTVDLAPGGSAAFTVDATVASAAVGAINNTATVSVPPVGFVDSSASNNSATDSDQLVASYDLCAGTGSAGSTAFPGLVGTMAIWGYVDCTASPSTPAAITAPGGPRLDAFAGDLVRITLHNNLGVATGLNFPNAPSVADVGGTTTTKTYTFTVPTAGTQIYEAGMVPGTQYQVAMGLYGALVVHPATPGQAYDSATTAFNDEGVLVLGEIDPALNKSPTKASFDMRNFKPKYFTINGKVYKDTAAIGTTAGNKVLLRYVNAGLSYHSMSLLGGSQQIIAYDGNPLTYAHSVVAETYGPGQTVDALVSTTGMAPGSKIAVYDANLLLNNGTTTGFGGMLTFINVGTAVVGSDASGPSTSNVTATPSSSNGSVDVALAASVSDVANGGSNVVAAEYYIDTTSGTGTALGGTFGSPTAAVSGTIPMTTVGVLSTGVHTIYVRGQDSVGNWGTFNFVTLNVDKTGPAISLASLSPNPSNGTSMVAVHATASDVTSGGGSIAAAEYTIDGGASAAMTVNNPLTVASIDANIPAATVNALATGSHIVSIRAQDNQGNWGTTATVNLIVDKAGPVTSGVSASPAVTNGVVGYNSSVSAVRISATATDGPSNVAALEGFIDSVGANGTGFVFFPVDSGFNSTVEAAYADIPLTSLPGLGLGSHNVYVHAKDSVGNWGANATAVTFTFDNVGPAVSGVTLTPPATNNQAVTLHASASDVATGNSNVAAAEYFIDATGTPVNGSGVAMNAVDALFDSSTEALTASITTAGLSAGSHTISVHGKDAVGNWGSRVNITLLIDRTPPTFSSVSLSPSTVVFGVANPSVLTVNGASDGAGGSGVNGGEYFIDGPAAGPVGAGVAFSGLTASIPTGALAIGQHIVWVRIHDAAGNWSTGTGGVRSATLTVAADTSPPTFSSITLTPSSVVQGTPVNLTVNGAVDNVGVTGGEYWFGTTNITPGTGTQFSGLTTSIPTGSLVGTNTVRVRIRDAAGNWSTGGAGVRIATLTVFTDAIFANGFETGASPWGWTSASTNTTTRLNVSAVAALVGTRGLQAQGNNTNFVQYNFGTATVPVAATYDAKFSFRPNSNASTGSDIFVAAAGTPIGTANTLFHVRYRFSGGVPQVQIQVGATPNPTWIAINSGSTVNALEVVWQSGGTLVLYVNGVSVQTLNGTAGSIGAVQLGSVTSGGSNLLMHFDAFSSKRSISPLYGP